MSRKYEKTFLEDLFRTLMRIRVFETRCIQLYRQGLIRGYLHPYLGEEAIATGVCAALRSQDYIVSTHRGHGHCIARGADINLMMAEIMGRRDGYCKGRGGSMHIADVKAGMLGANGIVGAGIPIGVGSALGAWIRGEDCVSVVFSSDGGANHGTFGEALNLAAAWSLPMILVIENNQYAVSTPISQSTRQAELHRRGDGYGVENRRLDGNNVLEMYEATTEAVEKCRSGHGPILFEAVTYRHSGHHVNDPGSYMPKEVLEEFRQKDPCDLGRRFLLESGGAEEEDARRIVREVEEEIESAIDFAKQSPQPPLEEFLEDIRSYV